MRVPVRDREDEFCFINSSESANMFADSEEFITGCKFSRSLTFHFHQLVHAVSVISLTFCRSISLFDLFLSLLPFCIFQAVSVCVYVLCLRPCLSWDLFTLSLKLSRSYALSFSRSLAPQSLTVFLYDRLCIVCQLNQLEIYVYRYTCVRIHERLPINVSNQSESDHSIRVIRCQLLQD